MVVDVEVDDNAAERSVRVTAGTDEVGEVDMDACVDAKAVESLLTVSVVGSTEKVSVVGEASSTSTVAVLPQAIYENVWSTPESSRTVEQNIWSDAVLPLLDPMSEMYLGRCELSRPYHVKVVTPVLPLSLPQPLVQAKSSIQTPASPQSLADITDVGQNPHSARLISTRQS
jgi:hypothetical protein